MTARRTDQLQPGDRVELGEATISAIITRIHQHGPATRRITIEIDLDSLEVRGPIHGTLTVPPSRLWIIPTPTPKGQTA